MEAVKVSNGPFLWGRRGMKTTIPTFKGGGGSKGI